MDVKQEKIVVDGMEYRIDQETADALHQGLIPQPLQEQIREKQGDDVCFEFCRQRRLMKKVCDEIDAGNLPAGIRPLVESGTVPAEILFKIYHHKLQAKADRLHKKNLISDEVMQTIANDLLTAEIIAPLERAIFVDMAMYLYDHQEITRDILDGVRDGSVDIKYIKVIRRYYRQMLSLAEVEQNHRASNEEIDLERLEILTGVSDGLDLERGMMQKLNQSYLKEALAWLPPAEAQLITQIYFDRIPMTNLAASLGVTEGTIRYRRSQILAKLKVILVDVMKLSRDILY